jgi:MarR-like DNA-binding transcriptional regulator SgrR of sgrS sRNA
LSLVANEDYWNGRPFLDAVEIELGRSLSDQFIALDLGRADVADLAVGRDRRVQPEGRRVIRSSPVELMAIVFARDPDTPDEAKAREALALSLDRGMMRTVLLQGEGEPAASLLPNWMTGYSSAFPADADPAKAQALKNEVRRLPAWTLGYTAGDALARVVADRIVLNALDVGLNMKSTNAATYDARVVRITLGPAEPLAALVNATAALGLPKPTIKGPRAEDLYAAEFQLLRTRRVIPLFHLPVSYGINRNVNSFAVREDGTWSLESVWVTGELR